MPKVIYAQEAWPGVYKLIAPFDKRLNEWLKEGVRWFDFNGDLGKKAWYVPHERLGDVHTWAKDHGYDFMCHPKGPVRCPEPTRLPLNQFQAAAFHRALDERALILQWPTGAGKSLPAIALADQMQRTLIVCPRAVVPNWTRELAKWGVDKTIHEMRPSRKVPDEQPEILIVSLGTVAKVPLHWRFDLIVYDELHNVMHASSARSRRAVNLSMQNPDAVRLGLSATPVSTRMQDYHQQLHVLCPHRWGSLYQWTERYHHVTLDGYEGARVVHGLRDDAKADYAATIESVVDIVGQDEVAQLYPPVTWESAKLAGNGKSCAPESLKAWQAEQGRVSKRRVEALIKHQIKTDKPYAVISYLRHTATAVAEALSIECITGGDVAHKRSEKLDAAPAISATMMSINEGLSLPQFRRVYVLESYPVPRYVEQVLGRFVRAYETAPVEVIFLSLPGTSDDVISHRLCARLREQDELYRSGKLRRGMLHSLELDIDSEDFLTGLRAAIENQPEEEDGGWE